MNKWVSLEDEEDFEQEKRIQDWLNEQGRIDSFEFKHITSKGTARNTRVRASFSLDQKIREDSTGTFADIIAGCDARDLFCGENPTAVEYLDAYLFCLGFDEGDSEWVIKTLR